MFRKLLKKELNSCKSNGLVVCIFHNEMNHKKWKALVWDYQLLTNGTKFNLSLPSLASYWLRYHTIYFKFIIEQLISEILNGNFWIQFTHLHFSHSDRNSRAIDNKGKLKLNCVTIQIIFSETKMIQNFLFCFVDTGRFTGNLGKLII